MPVNLNADLYSTDERIATQETMTKAAEAGIKKIKRTELLLFFFCTAKD